MTIEDQLKKMAADWDRRAQENARYFVATGKTDWSDEEFFASGEQTVEEQILTDMQNICQGREPGQMRVLEIGCGVGRVTRALAQVFGEVYAVDISGEMIARARSALSDFPNAHVYQNNGQDLSILPTMAFDFAFSSIVFQHIPSYEVIQSYVSDVSKILKSGCLFKFQVQGCVRLQTLADDTWVGVGFSQELMCQMAAKCDFELRYCHGMGTQDFWVWFFRK